PAKKISLHGTAAKVEVAVLETDLLAGLGIRLGDLEWGDLGLVEDPERSRLDLDVSRGELGVSHAFGARAHFPLHSRDELRPQGHLPGRCVRIKDDLRRPVSVPQIEEA